VVIAIHLHVAHGPAHNSQCSLLL